jgi:hypothetical protein
MVQDVPIASFVRLQSSNSVRQPSVQNAARRASTTQRKATVGVLSGWSEVANDSDHHRSVLRDGKP